MEKIGAIIQARMGSSRLPGKVLMPAVEKPLLELLVERLSYSKTINEIIIATSTSLKDNVIEEFCNDRNIKCYRGSEDDVLDRYYHTAGLFELGIVVRITSDCPLIDPVLCDEIIMHFLNHKNKYDLVTNRYPLTFPDGLDIDVMPFKALRYVWEHAKTKSQREHTKPNFWESGMKVFNYESDINYFKNYRWTLDYLEDYKLISLIYKHLYVDNQFPFSWKEIISFLGCSREMIRIFLVVSAPIQQINLYLS